MPRQKKDVTKSKSDINRDHYKVMLDNKSYSDYLKEEKKQKQLKLTLSVEEDSALRQYCTTIGVKPQEYILGLIRDDLERNGGINGDNAASTED